MKPAVVVLLALGAAACPRPRSATRVPPPAPTSGAAVQAAPSCESPELWLALYPRDALVQPYCRSCPARCDVGDINVPEERRGTELHMRWDFLHGDLLRFGCEDLEYAQRAIGAYHGAPIHDEPWASYFASKPWYRSRSSFELPPAAADNARWLATIVEVCKRTYLHGVVDVYMPAIRAWFDRKRLGSVQLAPALFVDFQPATKAQFLAFLAHHGDPGYFQYDLRTPVSAGFGGHWASHFPERTIWEVVVSTGTPTLSCVRETPIDCEGYESIGFLFDAATNELVGLHVTAAG